MQIKVSNNLKDVKRIIKGFEKQLPYATKLAIDETLKSVKKAVEEQLNKDIDRPTPFTKKAFQLTRAKKTALYGSVSIKPIQAEYLQYQIKGGKRKAKSKSPVIIPRKTQRNKYGNLPRGKLKKIKSRGKLIVKNGVALEALKTKLKPIAYFASEARYKKRFSFYERAAVTARKHFPVNMVQAAEKAMRTARR